MCNNVARISLDPGGQLDGGRLTPQIFTLQATPGFTRLPPSPPPQPRSHQCQSQNATWWLFCFLRPNLIARRATGMDWGPGRLPGNLPRNGARSLDNNNKWLPNSASQWQGHLLPPLFSIPFPASYLFCSLWFYCHFRRVIAIDSVLHIAYATPGCAGLHGLGQRVVDKWQWQLVAAVTGVLKRCRDNYFQDLFLYFLFLLLFFFLNDYNFILLIGSLTFGPQFSFLI